MALQHQSAHAATRNPLALAWLAVAVVVVLLDWWTKHLASTHLALYEAQAVFPWLNWRLAHNPGAAFSFLAGAGGWQRWFFTVLALAVSIFLVAWLFRTRRDERLVPLALVLVMGGAIGNAIDRLRFGYVVDFIDVHARGWHWPAFNVADSAIVCGIILLLLDAFREFLAERKARSGDQPS
ncbi:MAG: signal peptidase II [Xanthomonadales bacterium]|jgi:signal peptidase II|nr:signal peptidase II [Xanthomonadales bacterium]